MYRHILVPTDGSELSGQAVEHAVALAKAVGAKLTVVTVTVPYFAYAVEPDLAFADMETYLRTMEKLARQYLDAAKAVADAAGVPCDAVHVEHAQPYQAIIDAANDRICDLIVMASHGRRGIAALVLGSETHKVLTHSHVPVLVVRPPHGMLAIFRAT